MPKTPSASPKQTKTTPKQQKQISPKTGRNLPEIEDEFWDGDPVYENSTLGRKEGNSAWMDSFGIKCKQCSVISENRREFKKHLQVSPICYESSFALTTPSLKFR